MYFRSNFVKGHEYLYLVESRRQAGRVRQHVLFYFGRRDKIDFRAAMKIKAHFEGKAHLTMDQIRELRRRPPAAD